MQHQNNAGITISLGNNFLLIEQANGLISIHIKLHHSFVF